MRKIIYHKDLDERLGRLAERPDAFADACLDIIEEFDSIDADLEITNPATYRRHTTGRAKASFAQQFRADVDAIMTLDRETEAELARRIEFARLRLEKARREEGIEVEEGMAALAANPLSRRVSRRAMELHAMRTEMVERNLYLVLINVERYAGQSGTSRLDLIQEGSVSLFRAVDGFDWRRGLLFRTYAVHWLNQAFRNFLYNSSHTVRIPVYLQKALKHINQATIRLGDPSATVEEIAAETGDLNENLVSAALRAARGSYSIDADNPVSEEGSRLRDLLVDADDDGPYDARIEDVSLEAGLRKALEVLSDRERKVVEMRFGIGVDREHTLAEVAAEMGVSVERIRQIQVRALGKLNTPGLRRELDPFLN